MKEGAAMSSKNLEKVIQRAISDAAFRRLLQSNPEAALRGFKLTTEEVTAIRASDAGRLMSLGIDQRMSKAFSVSADTLVNRSSVDGLSIGGSAISDQGVSRLAGANVGDPATRDAIVDPGNVTRGASSINADQAHRAGERFPSDMSATRSANVDMDQRRGERLAGDATSSSTSSNADLAQRAGERAVGEATFATSANIDQAQRAGERIAGESSFATNANVDQAQRAGERSGGDATGGVAQHEPGSFGDPIKPVIDVDTDTAARSVVHDVAPTDLRGGFVDEDTVRSAVRDVNDVDLRGGLVAPVEGSPEAWAFQNAADASSASAATEGTMRSAIRDIAPPDVSSSSTYSGDDLAGPGYLANSDADAVRAVRDVTDVDLRGTASTPSGDEVRAVRDVTDVDLRGTAAALSGDEIRAVRDVTDVDLRGTAATTGADEIRAVRDVTDVDLRGTAATSFTSDPGMIPNADSAEAYEPTFHSGGTQGDAFLTSDEASQYSAGSADASGVASDEGQLYNPAADATTAIPEHHGGDASGDTPGHPQTRAQRTFPATPEGRP